MKITIEMIITLELELRFHTFVGDGDKRVSEMVHCKIYI